MRSLSAVTSDCWAVGRTTSVDRPALQRVADQPGRDRGGELVGEGVAAAQAGDLRLQVGLRLTVGLHLVDQRVVHLALQRSPAQRDADGEREEDRDDRDDVVAERDHVKSPWIQSSTSDSAPPIDDHQSSPTGRRGDRDAQGEQPGEEHEHQVPHAHPAGVELRDALGIHQLGAHPQAGQEGAREPGPLTVQELVEGGVRAHRDDQAGAAHVREQQRDVLAGAGRRQRLVPHAEPVEPVAAERPPGAVGVQDDLPRRTQGLVGDGGAAVSRLAALGQPVLADHDDVGAVPGGDQRVGAGVHADQDRALLADEPLEPAQVLAVVVAADDHDDGTALDHGAGLRDALAVQQQLLLAAQELGGVVGEALQLAWTARCGRPPSACRSPRRRARGRWPRSRRRRTPRPRAAAPCCRRGAG